MPIGISFFTFQGMSYVIDLYWRKVTVQKNPAKLAFYISFFPQLIAGPIVRYIDIKEQIDKRTVSVEKFAAGTQRFVIGLAKKIIIANTVGEVVDLIFSLPVSEISAATAWLGVICWSFQVYFDFSGYSDMAIGLGKMFGFEFLENFNYPYISKTITEFWSRWHISLSSWFRDYVYIPLGGNRKGNVYVNLLFLFALVGFWHGANFQFLAWGLWHGSFLVIERIFGMREVKNKKFIPLRYFVTMLIVVVGMAFFRGSGVLYALKYIGVMFGFIRPEFAGFSIWFFLSPKIIIMLCLAAAASTPLLKTAFTSIKCKQVIYGLILALLLVCMFFVAASSYNPFIYFRF
jgi:alginate O-acetyltransferase complex protein AlgI